MTRPFVTAAILAACVAGIGHAGDWPAWRGGPGRTAATAEPLPEQLHLQWSRQFPMPRAAWPDSQPALRFDEAVHPVAAGGRMFVGSANDDSVTAFDAATGEQRWTFFTGGPVRFAPVVDGGRVFAASDDGCLYALRADTGALLWKFEGSPTRRRILGNGRMISTWSARGGPVVADGVVYFTAGIWPSMGVFVHAVNAETGRVLWTNSETGSRYTVHPHGAPAFGSVAPQGYLAVAGDYLVVPGGRSMPAVFDRQTGELLHFEFGPKNGGGWWAVASGDAYLFEGSQLGLADGKRVADAPGSVVSQGTMIGTDDGSLVVQPIGPKEDGRAYPLEGPEPEEVHLAAGRFVYTSGEGRIACYPIPEPGAKGESPLAAVWSAELDGDIVEMLAADGRLFVVTADATVHCFGTKEVRPTRHAPAVNPLPPRGEGEGRAYELPRSVQVGEGFALCTGPGGGRLAEDFVTRPGPHVIVIEPDARVADELRRRFAGAGLYGSRVTVVTDEFADSHLPAYFANLVVGDGDTESMAGLLRVLRPYGGTAWLSCDEDTHRRLAARAADPDMKGSELTRQGDWSVLTRVGPVPDTGQWSHQYADPGNTGISKDHLVKAPLGVLWFGGPANDDVLPRHGHGPAPQVAGGRLFIEGPDMLRAVDVFTGRLLWERDLPGIGEYYNTTRHFAGAGEVGSNYVSLPDRVYVAYGKNVLELDAATGATRKTFRLRGDDPDAKWGFLAATDDLLVATSNPVKLEVLPDLSKLNGGVPEGFEALIKPHAEWDYLGVTDPPKGWAEVGFEGEWKSGKAGFGFDKSVSGLLKIAKGTPLPDKNGGHPRVHLRKSFDAADLKRVSELALLVDYDDAFIAYLNGKEIARAGVEGKSPQGYSVKSHEAEGHEFFLVKDFRKLLRPGENVLAIVAHNVNGDSSDFWIDPYVIANKGEPIFTLPESATPEDRSRILTEWLKPADYAPASRQLVAFDRHTGEVLWTREAKFEFRHNAIALGAGKVFCIDGVSPRKLEVLERRGLPAAGDARLLALDARTGRTVWETGEDVFGTFLSYSADHDVLLQAGSAYRDRAWDEVDRGMVAYQGGDGKVIWKDLKLRYDGPCLLWRDKIITNGSKGFQLELFTGKRTGWEYQRMYGCNSIVGSEHLLTFRSGAAGFCELDGGGTGNLGGFRSGCTANLIIADGVLSAPDYTRTCVCAYQNQCSLAFVHMPEAEVWTFGASGPDADGPTRIGINLGAPGDRRDDAGTLWLDYPNVGGPSPEVDVTVKGDGVEWYRKHSSYVAGQGQRWVAASGGKGIRSFVLKLGKGTGPAERYTVRLHFAEPEAVAPGERVFDVSLQGRTVLDGFDVVKEAGGVDRATVRQFEGVSADGAVNITMTPTRGSKRPPILSGVEVIEER